MASSVGVGEDPSHANNAPDLSSSTSSFSQDDGHHDYFISTSHYTSYYWTSVKVIKKSTSACSLPCSRGAQKRGSFQKLDDPEWKDDHQDHINDQDPQRDDQDDQIRRYLYPRAVCRWNWPLGSHKGAATNKIPEKSVLSTGRGADIQMMMIINTIIIIIILIINTILIIITSNHLRLPDLWANAANHG